MASAMHQQHLNEVDKLLQKMGMYIFMCFGFQSILLAVLENKQQTRPIQAERQKSLGKLYIIITKKMCCLSQLINNS